MRFRTDGGALDAEVKNLIVAGWTGRDRAGIDHHIAELAELGVKPPSTVPLFYRASADLLTQADAIQCVGGQTSGEVEPMVLQIGGRRWLGLASDHTDRALEAHSVALSKQICAKPCAPDLWPWDEVADRLDRLEMSSWIEEGGEWVPYQHGTLAAISPLAGLIRDSGLEKLAKTGPVAMICGTFGVLSGGVRPAARFRMELHDPVAERRISHEYAIENLPEIS